MRRLAILLLLVSAGSAQDQVRAIKHQARLLPAFVMLKTLNPGIALPGALERVNESMDELKRQLEKHPADVAALERANLVLARISRSSRLLPLVEFALEEPGITDAQRAKLRGLRGYLACKQTSSSIVLPPDLSEKQLRKILEQLERRLNSAGRDQKTTIEDLRAAARADPTDMRSRQTLADLLRVVNGAREVPDAEVERLLNEVAAIRLREQGEVAPPVDLTISAGMLREQADTLEQVQEKPRHDEALALRKRALICDFCTHTIPFQPDLELWEPVALLAPENMVQENLTRTFITSKGEVSTVRAQYFRPPVKMRVDTVKALGRSDGDTAAAALLAVLRTARGDSVVTDAALEATRQEAARKHLPRLLATALFSRDKTYFHPYGRRLLVRLAGELKAKECAPVLRRVLVRDDDLYIPLGVADALGRIGLPEDAALLLARAKDKRIDIYFRREAVEALSRVAPEQLAGLEGDPDLEIAVAAARYRLEPNDSDLGRILTGLDRFHEPDEAARYCYELKIRGALPALETFLQERKDHYAAKTVARYAELLKALPH